MNLLITDAAGLRCLTLDRPEKRNALTGAMLAALCDAIIAAGADAAVRAVVIAGRGAHFCAGADLDEMRANPGDTERAAMTGWMLQAPRNIGKPVIAAVHGAALGAGAALALACDAVVMAQDARIGWPEALHGILPRAVAPQLIHRVPPAVAFELLATGRSLDATQAHALGLAARVVPGLRLMPEASALALGAALLPPAGLLELKRMIGV